MPSQQTITFLIFVSLGIIFSFIFDIFRAIRKIKKVKDKYICLQDIIYFIVIGIILLLTIINYMNTEIRMYLLLAIIIGIIIYISVFGNHIRNLFIKLFKLNEQIINFVLLPLEVYRILFNKQINILKKIVIKCCKKISYMINFKCIKSKFVFFTKKFKTKEDRLNDKSRKQSC